MKAPWHLWVIGAVSLLWNAFGAYDFLLTQLVIEDYLAMMTEPQRAMMDSRPAWFDASWALGVWGSVLGSILLLLRSRHAVTAFAFSILGLIVSSIWSYGLADPSALEVVGGFAAIFSVVICVVLVLLFVYSRAMARRAILN